MFSMVSNAKSFSFTSANGAHCVTAHENPDTVTRKVVPPTEDTNLRSRSEVSTMMYEQVPQLFLQCSPHTACEHQMAQRP